MGNTLKDKMKKAKKEKYIWKANELKKVTEKKSN